MSLNVFVNKIKAIWLFTLPSRPRVLVYSTANLNAQLADTDLTFSRVNAVHAELAPSLLTCPTHTEQLHVLCGWESHRCDWVLARPHGGAAVVGFIGVSGAWLRLQEQALHQGLPAKAYLSAICCSVGTAGAPWGCGASSGAKAAAGKLLVGPGAGAMLAS